MANYVQKKLPLQKQKQLDLLKCVLIGTAFLNTALHIKINIIVQPQQVVFPLLVPYRKALSLPQFHHQEFL